MSRSWILAAASLLAFGATTALGQDEHWSRQFAKPKASNKMLPGSSSYNL